MVLIQNIKNLFKNQIECEIGPEVRGLCCRRLRCDAASFTQRHLKILALNELDLEVWFRNGGGGVVMRTLV